MPIYEYQCQSCGHQFDEMQKFSDDPLTTCPECKQDALNKLMSATSFKLTGGGWYETDFKNKGKAAPVAESAASESAADSKSTDTSSKKEGKKDEK